MKQSTKDVALRTGIYVRVSTDEQVQEGYSIRAQTDKLKQYALLKDWQIYDIYADEGISGKNIVDRPAINRLIDDINDGKVNNVLVFKVDRLTRSTKNLLELVELFEECNCAFNSLTESIDTDTPSGRMFLKIIGIFAEFERENLVSRLKLGFERKAKEGYTLANSIMSYGYSREKGQKVQTILPGEARIVKEIFEMYVNENKSMCGIARSLNERKIPTKKNAVSWNTGTLKGVLTNPTYIGKVRYAIADENRYFETDGHHERIVSDELYNLAQEKIANIPKYSRTKKPRDSNYYCGVLVCDYCGGKFTTHNYKVKSGEDKTSYRCANNASFKTSDVTCKSPSIIHDKLETAFVDYIKNINDLTELEDVTIENKNTIKAKETQEYIKSCEKKLETLNMRKKKIMEQYVSEELTFEEYKVMLGVFDEKFDMLTAELQKARLEMPSENEPAEIVKSDIIASMKENWDYLSNNEKMTFLQRFVKRIHVKVEKTLGKANIVNIEKLEFNSVVETEVKRTSVLSRLKGLQGR